MTEKNEEINDICLLLSRHPEKEAEKWKEKVVSSPLTSDLTYKSTWFCSTFTICLHDSQDTWFTSFVRDGTKKKGKKSREIPKRSMTTASTPTDIKKRSREKDKASKKNCAVSFSVGYKIWLCHSDRRGQVLGICSQRQRPSRGLFLFLPIRCHLLFSFVLALFDFFLNIRFFWSNGSLSISVCEKLRVPFSVLIQCVPTFVLRTGSWMEGEFLFSCSIFMLIPKYRHPKHKSRNLIETKSIQGEREQKMWKNRTKSWNSLFSQVEICRAIQKYSF